VSGVSQNSSAVAEGGQVTEIALAKI